MDQIAFEHLSQELKIRPHPTRFAYKFLFITLLCLMTSLFCITISPYYLLNILGTILLSINMVQWFVIMHECGHGTFVKQKKLNLVIGHISAFFCMLPYFSWQKIHHDHHMWTGWKDKDPTTSQVVQLQRPKWQQKILQFFWQTRIPIFMLLYRINNFWNLPRLMLLYRRQSKFLISSNLILLFLAYSLGIFLLELNIILLFLIGFYIHLMLTEPIMLSQHTHIPQNIAANEKVKPFRFFEQEEFTRTLIFPHWISKYILYYFDAHEAHHLWPHVSATNFCNLNYHPARAKSWDIWYVQVRKMDVNTLLFQNSKQTQIDI